jgi:hypothetical protein
MDLALVEEEKITKYLLSDSHPVGRSKAAFFQRFGFRSQAWEVLRDAILEHARSESVVSTTETAFGKKCIIEGPLECPDGRRPLVRTVWFIEQGEEIPRLVTAIPISGDWK